MPRTPARKPRPSDVESDPVRFWLSTYTQAKRDVASARKVDLTVLPRLEALRREAWLEYLSARANAAAAATSPAETAIAAAIDTSLEGMLANVTRLRQAAEAKGSMVAAGKLLVQEAKLMDDIRKRDALEAERERRALGETELLDAVLDRLAMLPDALKARLREVLGG